VLYLIDVSIDDRGFSLDELFAEWEKETEAVIGARQAGVVKTAFKVVGDRRVIAIMDIDSHDVLDDMFMGQLPLAHHIVINEITPIREYDTFAASVKRRFAPS
jgi:muconolactone delta-isomerase